MSRKPKIYKVDLDDLDNLIISIIKSNAGISPSLLHRVLNNDFFASVKPEIVLSRLERLISLNIVFNHTEKVGKYFSRRFYYNKEFDKVDNNLGEQQ